MAQELKNLAWLADAPLFIDQAQISALYDAVVRPEHKEGTTTVTLRNLDGFDFEGKAAGKIEVGLAPWLTKIFPFLEGKATADIGGGVIKKVSREEGSQIELHSIETPQRQLLQLALHYIANLPTRFKIVSNPGVDDDWLSSEFITALPRSIVFVDFPSLTTFVPMAAEVEGGTVVTMYPELMRAFAGPKDKPPTYPEPAYYKDKMDELVKDRKQYWAFFSDHFSSTLAMESIEEKVKQGGRIRWIAFRIPFPNATCLHLDLCGRGEFDTGTFAYRLVKRGYKHGVRIIGTLKSEPDMNVLAVFEK